MNKEKRQWFIEHNRSEIIASLKVAIANSEYFEPTTELPFLEMLDVANLIKEIDKASIRDSYGVMVGFLNNRYNEIFSGNYELKKKKINVIKSKILKAREAMNKYLELMNQVQQYLNYPDVISNNEIISAYDLMKIINNDLKEIREIADKETFKEKINKRYINPIKSSKRFFLSRVKITSDFADKIDFIHFETKQTKSEIFFLYCNHGCARLAREFYSKDIYYETFNKDRDGYLIKEFLTDINNIFDVLEKYSLRYQSNIDSSTFVKNSVAEVQKFSDGFFDISIELRSGFILGVSISINDSVDPEEVYKKEWIDYLLLKILLNKIR